jgi:hypothetical protein
MRLWSDSEVDGLIEELTAAANEAVEKAAAEAAKAAVLASLEREAAVLREKALSVAEAEKWKGDYMRVKADRVKSVVLAGLIGFVSGAAVGGAVLIVAGGR